MKEGERLVYMKEGWYTVTQLQEAEGRVYYFKTTILNSRNLLKVHVHINIPVLIRVVLFNILVGLKCNSVAGIRGKTLVRERIRRVRWHSEDAIRNKLRKSTSK
jgi:hypothetical protein